MTEPTHIPAPWLFTNKTVYALMPDGFRARVEQFKNRFWLTVQADRDVPEEEIEANVRLIAAAPDMLAELLAIHEQAVADLDDMACDRGNHDGGGIYPCDHCGQAAFAKRLDVLIAKAVGLPSNSAAPG